MRVYVSKHMLAGTLQTLCNTERRRRNLKK